MKKLFFILIFMGGLSSILSAQIEKGKYMVGGSMGFFSTTSGQTDFNYTSFGIYPRVGLFVSDKFLVGTGINLGIFWSVREPSYSVGISPFARFYPFSLFYIEGEVGYSRSISDYSDTDFLRISPSIGYTIFLNDFVAIEPRFSADFRPSTRENFSSYTNFSGQIGFQIFLDKLKLGKS